jgi:hypothetical protein
MVISIVIGLLLSPYRIIFTKKKTWLAALLALIIIAPNVFWQYQHNWPLVHHMKELQETQLKYNNKFEFFKDQLMMLLPVAAVWIAGLIWVLRKKEWRVIGIIYLSIIALLVFGSGKAYYALSAYPMLLAAGGVVWENLSERKKWIRYVLTLIIIGLNWLAMPMLLPIWKPEKLAAFYEKVGEEHKWEDLKTHPLPQDFADMLGWKELTTKTEKFFNSLPDSAKTNSIIFCGNYGQAGSLKFYGKDKNFKNKIISASGSFLLWIPENITMKHLILVDEEMPGKEEELFQHFSTSTVIDSVTNKFSRQYGNKIIFYENIDSTGLRMAQEGLKKKKSMFIR